MSRKKTFFGESLLMNNSTFMGYFYRLAEIAMSRYEWINLPETCDARYLEMSLFTQNCAVFMQDDVVGIVTLSALPESSFNLYGDPLRIRGYSRYNDVQISAGIDDCVLVWNNQMHTSDFRNLQDFAKRLYNLDRTIDVNVGAQKTPVLLAGRDTQQLTLKNLYKEYDGNAPVIFGDSNLDINGLRCLKTDAPYVSDKLYELKVYYWNEALTYLGIPNTNVMKRERVITDEVRRAQAGAFASRNSSLYTRKRACEKFNQIWPGYNVDVRFRVSDTENEQKEESEELEKEVIVDG